MACFSDKTNGECVGIGILLSCGVILVGLCGCVAWERDVVINGIHFDRFAHSSIYGTIGYTGEDTVIQGYPCKRGVIYFHPDYSLDEFLLSQSIELNGFRIPAETYVTLDKEGHIGNCAFPEDVEVQGYPCRGGWGGPEGVRTYFHTNGNLVPFPRRSYDFCLA